MGETGQYDELCHWRVFVCGWQVKIDSKNGSCKWESRFEFTGSEGLDCIYWQDFNEQVTTTGFSLNYILHHLVTASNFLEMVLLWFFLTKNETWLLNPRRIWACIVVVCGNLWQEPSSGKSACLFVLLNIKLAWSLSQLTFGSDRAHSLLNWSNSHISTPKSPIRPF